MSEFTIQVKGMKKVIEKVKGLEDKTALSRMNKEIGRACVELTADHIAKKVSPTHHKVADRLGAQHTGFFEFARGREGRAIGKDHGEGKVGFIEERGASDTGVSIVIGNTPGISRAFHDLDITPKRAKMLTIPIHRDSYGKRVADFRTMNPSTKVFRVKSKRNNFLLMGVDGKGKKKVTRPLYALVKKSHIPQDRGLLPEDKEYVSMAKEAAQAFLDVELL